MHVPRHRAAQQGAAPRPSSRGSHAQPASGTRRSSTRVISRCSPLGMPEALRIQGAHVPAHSALSAFQAACSSHSPPYFAMASQSSAAPPRSSHHAQPVGGPLRVEQAQQPTILPLRDMHTIISGECAGKKYMLPPQLWHNTQSNVCTLKTPATCHTSILKVALPP